MRVTNFVMIVADDMRADMLGRMTMTKHAGARYSSAYVTNPVCCASRVCTLTGRHSHTTGIWGNNPPYGGYEQWRDSDGQRHSIAPALRDIGYRTALMGKYVNEYNLEHVAQVPDGWTDWLAITQGGSGYYDTRFSDDGADLLMSPGVYLTDYLAERAEEFIAEVGTEPFLLWLSPVSPHKEHVPAPRHQHALDRIGQNRPPSFDAVGDDVPEFYAGQDPLTPEDVANIDAVHLAMSRTVLSLDELVQRVIDALIASGHDDDTMLWFTSDNGFMLGEHRLYGKSVPYLEATRMPLVVRAPGFAVVDSDALIQNIDWAPTIAEIAGAEGTFDGRSVLSELTGGEGRGFVYAEHHAQGEQPAFVQAQRRNRVYTYHSTGEEEWYNLELDPWQMGERIEIAVEEEVEAARQYVRASLRDGPPPGMVT